MFRLLYVSSSVRFFFESELISLLKSARAANSQLGITGLLLYRGGKFMQVLEGEEKAVRSLYKKISLDPRHNQVSVVFEESTEKRQFPDWSMGFYSLDDSKALVIPGYNEFLNLLFKTEELKPNLTRCEQFLSLFKKDTEQY